MTQQTGAQVADHQIAPAAVQAAKRPRRSAGLVGNWFVLAGFVLNLLEFVGIIATHVHSMPALPGASDAELMSTYAGQAGAVGFLVGWFTLTTPARVLAVLGLRMALSRSGHHSVLSDYAVVLMAVGVPLEILEYGLCAGAITAIQHGNIATAAALNQVAHYALVGVYGPGALAFLLLALGMWRSGVFPRVLTIIVGVLALVGFLNGTFLAAPGQSGLQDSVTIINLVGIPFNLWLAILVAVKSPKRRTATV